MKIKHQAKEYLLGGVGVIILALLAFLAFDLDYSLTMQERVNYEQCLSWQAHGYGVQCHEPKGVAK